MNITSEISHPLRVVRDVRVKVVESVWQDGGRSFDVYAVDAQNDCWSEFARQLTAESFDAMPTDQQIERLPYIAPSLRREYAGVWYVDSGPYSQGPYTHTEARAIIRSGKW